VWFSSVCSGKGKDSSLKDVISTVFCVMCIINVHTISYYTGCPRGDIVDFGKMFLRLNYIGVTKNTYIRSGTLTEIMTREVSMK
jgi:hypothetical protein